MNEPQKNVDRITMSKLQTQEMISSSLVVVTKIKFKNTRDEEAT